jgi:hypothetical protein
MSPLFFGLPSEAVKPGLLKETDVAPTRGKSIRIAPTVGALGEGVAGNGRV